MKTTIRLSWALLFAILGFGITACDSKDDPKPDPLEGNHFDIWVSSAAYTGAGTQDNIQLVKGVKSLDNQENIDFKGTGADVTAKLFQETIIKDGFYYQVPKEKDRFGKYQIINNKIITIKEFSFDKNTLKERKYTHCWLDNNTLVLLAANGNSSKVIWIKVNAQEMKIISEGELNLEALPKGGTYSTSGIASYRKSDNTILYSYVNNKDKTKFFMAFVNPDDMSVKATVEENRAEFMAGTAFGELLQSKSFFDNDDNYYLACNNVIPGAPSTTQQFGTILRIKKGEMKFDPDYKGFQKHTKSHGKIITVEFLTKGKALIYVQDPKFAGVEEWAHTYNNYYAILDLATDELTVLDLPFSEGTFSQRSVVIGNKAYIGVNPEKSQPSIYIYDIPTGKLTKGLTITEGYSFDRIVTITDK